MNRQRQIALAIVLAGVALLYLQLAHRRQSLHVLTPGSRNSPVQVETGKQQAGSGSNAATPGSSIVEEPVASNALAGAPRLSQQAAVATEPIPDTPESTSLPPETILENVRTTIRQYASEFGENPVGTNPEITSALQGDNPKHINFLKQDGSRVNAKGELVDAWGTPYFFHQISGREMEIRSAGPDRIMYTGDDFVTR